MVQPPEDREMDITEHIAELRKRILRICVILIVTVSVMFYLSYAPLLAFWHTLVGDLPIYVFSPIEWVVIRLSFSVILSLVFLYPYIMYELYLFAKPGLYEHERRFLRAMLVPSYIIFIAGLFFAYRFAIPILYHLALASSFDPYLSAERTIMNAFKLLIAFGIFFQIPLAMSLAVHFRIVDHSTLRNLRLPLYLIVLLLVTNLTMDFTGLTQFASLALFVCMYEVGLLMLRIFKG